MFNIQLLTTKYQLRTAGKTDGNDVWIVLAGWVAKYCQLKSSTTQTVSVCKLILPTGTPVGHV